MDRYALKVFLFLCCCLSSEIFCMDPKRLETKSVSFSDVLLHRRKTQESIPVFLERLQSKEQEKALAKAVGLIREITDSKKFNGKNDPEFNYLLVAQKLKEIGDGLSNKEQDKKLIMENSRDLTLRSVERILALSKSAEVTITQEGLGRARKAMELYHEIEGWMIKVYGVEEYRQRGVPGVVYEIYSLFRRFPEKRSSRADDKGNTN